MKRPRAQSQAGARSQARGYERAKAIRKSRARGSLLLERLEERTLLSVTATLNSGVLDVALSAANDQALIAPSGSMISVSGTELLRALVLGRIRDCGAGRNTDSQDAPNQSVTFGGGGGTIALDAASGADALEVSGSYPDNLHKRHDRRDGRERRRRGLGDDVGGQQRAAYGD